MEPTIRLFADQALLCGEGPVWDTDSGRLYWTDAGGEAVFHQGLHGGVSQLLFEGYHAGGLVLHQSGGVIFGGRDGFFHWNEGAPPRLIVNRCGNVAVNHINDIIADPMGRIFGGQEAFREDETYDTGYLFCIDIDGSCSIVEEGLHLSNGMGFSPSNDCFYLVDTIQRTVYAYDYDMTTGAIANKRSLIRLDRNDGLPDGMTVDKEGFLWIARWFGGGISRYDPDGRLERRINLPAAQTSSLTFGGPHCRDIFITTAAQYWQTPLAPANHDFSTNRGGSVYHIVQDIEGRPEYKAKIYK